MPGEDIEYRAPVSLLHHLYHAAFHPRHFFNRLARTSGCSRPEPSDAERRWLADGALRVSPGHGAGGSAPNTSFLIFPRIAGSRPRATHFSSRTCDSRSKLAPLSDWRRVSRNNCRA